MLNTNKDENVHIYAVNGEKRKRQTKERNMISGERQSVRGEKRERDSIEYFKICNGSVHHSRKVT